MSKTEAAAKRNIAITGLTATGKTTHSKITVAQFGFNYVSASSILRRQAGLSGEPPADFWLSTPGIELSRRIIELGIDELLREAEDTGDQTVFDCRSLPWLAKSEMLSLWLESSIESRVWKALVSHGSSSKVSEDQVLEEINLKDERDRENLWNTYGFDLFVDREPMDVVLDISDLISAPTIEASWRSIQVTQDIISAIVGLYLTRDVFYRTRLRALCDELGSVVFRRFSPRFLDILNF